MLNLENLKPKIVEALKQLQPKKIILFGSYAYGTPTEDSDLDICVIEEDYKDKWKEKRKIRDALKNIRIAKDILVETEEYFLSHSNENWINTALYDVRHKGIILYEKN